MITHKQIQERMEVGQIFKNFKVLSAFMQQEVKNRISTNTKKSREKEWKRHFDWEKSGQKYIITEVYKSVLAKEDKRLTGNNSLYVEHVKLLLLDYLSKQKGYKASFTLKNLFLFLCLCNNNYTNKEVDIIVKQENIDRYNVNHFYQRTYKKFKEIVFASLNSLKKQCLIDYTEKTMVSINTNNKKIIRSATDIEKSLIIETKKEVLKQMGLESMTLVYLKFKQKEFFAKVNYLLLENYNINYTWTEINIIFNHNHIVEPKEKSEIILNKKMLNNKVIKFVDNQAKKNLIKNQKIVEEQEKEIIDSIIGRPNPMDRDYKKIFRLEEDKYLHYQERLSKLLLRL